MACCALAAFLISQIIFALDWARERLGWRTPSILVENQVVAWRLGDRAAADPHEERRHRPTMAARLAMAAAGGVLAFAVLAALTVNVEAGPHSWNSLSLICTGHGLERLTAPAGG